MAEAHLTKRQRGDLKRQFPKEYKAWQSMKQRCYNATWRGYFRYGGRGIKVCDRWRGRLGFAAFIADMGPKPSPGHSLDRRDNSGHYEPSNCRWATREEQAGNRRNPKRTRSIAFRGEATTYGELAKRFRMKYTQIWYRVETLGWSVEDAVAKPIKRSKLTFEQAEDIRNMHRQGASQTSLAKRFGVTYPVINQIILGRAHVRQRYA